MNGKTSKKKINKKHLIYGFLKEGLSKKDSAKMAGIDESTLYRWINNDASFASQIEENILEYKRSLIKSVNATARQDGKFALKILERLWSDEWGIKQQVEYTEKKETDLTDIADLLQAIYDKEDSKVTALVS